MVPAEYTDRGSRGAEAALGRAGGVPAGAAQLGAEAHAAVRVGSAVCSHEAHQRVPDPAARDRHREREAALVLRGAYDARTRRQAQRAAAAAWTRSPGPRLDPREVDVRRPLGHTGLRLREDRPEALRVRGEALVVADEASLDRRGAGRRR